MAALIKNQIIKRLSKFVKNLSSNQINLSTLKGEGELSSINLDEKTLEDVIELPTWLKIQKATCGRVFIKIPWTNLKTLPIQIQLDDVLIEIETCEKLRDLQTPSNGNDPLIGKYGFTNRVIDGISLTITNLRFAIKAQNFKASIFLPSLDIYSITPNGKRVDTLTLTRLRNTTKNHILLFKEISWPNARIEASSNDNDLPGTAIRFIANSCRIRISMKKNLQDSTMISSRLTIHFDDLLSVVNDAQLNSALNTYKEIIQLMKQASDQRKRTVGEKLTRLERQSQPSMYQPKPPTTGTDDPIKSLITESQQSNDPFIRYDIIETSLHFNIKRLDLHIVADGNDRLMENGSLQMTFANLSIDHYPYHEFGSSKKHWINYSDIQSTNRNEWANLLQEEWHEQFNLAKFSIPNDDVSIKFEKALRTNRIRLFESCSVISIDDFVFYPVSLNNDKQQKRRKPLLTSDKAYYQLPDSLGIINIQHTEYYYPLPYSFPVPNSDLYIQIMPLVIRLDFVTTSWLDAFISTLSITISNSGVLKTDESSLDLEHVAVKIDAMLPRIIISSDIFQKNDQSNEQQSEILELNISKMLITNTRIELTSDRKKLEQHLESIKQTNFFQQTQWPFSNTQTTRISSIFEKHPYETYLYNNPLSKKTGNLPEPQSTSRALHNYYTMTTDSLKKSAKYDIWHFHASNIYLDFTPSSESIRFVKQNMVDTLSVTGWAVLDEKEKNPWANVLCILESPSLLKISQKQYTFVMHIVDELGKFIDILEHTKTQTRLMKQNSSSTDLKITICLTASTTFTLAVIDGLENEILRSSTPPSSTLIETEIEPILRDTPDIDLVTPTIPTVASTIKFDPSSPNKTPKKSKFEENLQRGLEFVSKGSRGSSISSLMNMTDNSDETLSQLDITEYLDADLEASLFLDDTEQQQQKLTRIKLDDDSISLTGKTYIPTIQSESLNGVFVKLNQINVCITEDEEKIDQSIFIACNVKYIRLDEFSSMKFDAIKPKLFENEHIDELNSDDVPPINVRIDFVKGESPSPPPLVTVKIQDRSLTSTSHALDILQQNLEEIFTDEEKILRQNQPPKSPPIDIYLNNVQLILKFLHEYSTIEIKPTVKLNIEYLHILRQIDGQIIIRENRKQITNNNSDENLRQLELLRIDNERLRSELNAQKTDIIVLRGERDSLMNTISKLDIELTKAEHQRVSQQQQQQQSIPRKK